ncbi:hypothetical protein SELMODRAFT_407502 [Selaginella moellendorffii]|uniref:Uncharacterized protein n=1 Tax=Selaginella moellendorffii TaxID=88036 RepID=D8R5T8_SELML|nr:hypothetical protein SELMODRAFT_407502 [Selaginella moellendorffii]
MQLANSDPSSLVKPEAGVHLTAKTISGTTLYSVWNKEVSILSAFQSTEMRQELLLRYNVGNDCNEMSSLVDGDFENGSGVSRNARTAARVKVSGKNSVSVWYLLKRTLRRLDLGLPEKRTRTNYSKHAKETRNEVTSELEKSAARIGQLETSARTPSVTSLGVPCPKTAKRLTFSKRTACLGPGSNRRPLVCETSVITNYTTQTYDGKYLMEKSKPSYLQYFALDNGLEGVTKLEVDDPRYTFTGDFKVNDVLEMIKKKKKCICVESIQEIAEPDKDKHDSCCCCSSCC